MYQNQNGMSICFPSQNTSQYIFIELGPCEVDGVGGGAGAALQQVTGHLLHHAVLAQFCDLGKYTG